MNTADLIRLRPTRCAICGTDGNSREIYPERLGADAFNNRVFSARRAPDRIHYRMVRCESCRLVRADPAGDPEMLAALYERSAFDYGPEIPNLTATYSRYLSRLGPPGPGRSSLLEIGCGNGFMLEAAITMGYRTVRGVEPSADAVMAASSYVREAIVKDILRPGQFAAGTIDSICMFQVFDHVPDPAALLAECRTLLAPRGRILILNHNVEAFSANLLRELSPIIDVEHCYLYSRATLARICEASGLRVIESGPTSNLVSVRHLLHLAPLPAWLKRSVVSLANWLGIGGASLSVRIGNCYAIAEKPA
jgi:SAM-dependent methyltransferase